jgi:HEAT repeat protein
MDIKHKYIQLLHNFRIALSYLTLYPSSSRIVQNSMKDFYSSFEDIFKENGEIVISEAEKNLLIDGEIIAQQSDKAIISSILEIFIKHNIKSVTFTKDMSLDELLLFCEELKKKKLEEDIFKIPHIIINQKVYVAKDEKEKVEEISKVEEEKIEKEVPTSQKSIDEITNELLKQENTAMISEDVVKELPQLLQKLDLSGRVDLASQIVDKLMTNIEDKDADIRLKTVQSFKKISPTIESLSDKTIIEKTEDKFIIAEDKETVKPVYEEIADLLEYAAEKLINQGKYEKTIRIVSMFRTHAILKGEVFFDRWMIAKNVLDRVSNPHVISILVSDLRSDNPKIRDEAYAIIMNLQDAAVPQLIEMIKETENLHLRKVIGFVIKNMGDESIQMLVESLRSNMPFYHAKRIIEILDGIGNEEVIVGYLENIFFSLDSEIKKEVMKLLYKINLEKAKELLATTLNSSEIEIKMLGIELLGKLKYKKIVDALLSNISFKCKEDERIQEVSCIALGEIGDAKAIPALAEIVSPPPFFSFKKRKSKKVILAAISSLGDFIDEKATEILNLLKESKDKEIAQAAQNAITKQKTIVKRESEDISKRLL